MACGETWQRPSNHFQWCTNACQPPLEALIQIAQCLEVDIKELIRVPEHNPYKEL